MSDNADFTGSEPRHIEAAMEQAEESMKKAVQDRNLETYWRLQKQCAERAASAMKSIQMQNVCTTYLKQAEKKISQGNDEKAAFCLELLDMRLRGYTNKLRGNPFQLHQTDLKDKNANSHPSRFGKK